MITVILGATGGVGRHLVAQAIEAGHRVTAVTRDAEAFTPPVRNVVCPLPPTDLSLLVEAVSGADAVLSALGPRRIRDARNALVTRATGAVLDAMAEAGTRRLIVVSAIPVATVPPARDLEPPGPPADLLTRAVFTPVMTLALGPIYDDLSTMEERVRTSVTEWTIVRPPRLVDRQLTRRYRTSFDGDLHHGRSIPRADVAHFMLQAATNSETINKVVRIAT